MFETLPRYEPTTPKSRPIFQLKITFFEVVCSRVFPAPKGGDAVLVAPGTYYECVDFLGKAITVASQAGPWDTIIEGVGGCVTVFTTNEAQDSVLQPANALDIPQAYTDH